jgi:hypothetical protein
MERPFNIRQNRPIKIILSLFLIVSFFSCGSQSPSTNNSDTGSFAVSLQWPEDAPTLETSYSTARQAAVDCDAAGIVTISFAFYDENENFLIDDEWSCSLHIGTVYGIPAGSNRHLVVTGKDASGTVLYQGEKFGITITSGETTDGGIVEMMPVVVQKWAKTYGGVNDEDIEAIQTLSGGGYIVAARTQSFGFGDPDPEIGNTDIWIFKLNANGSVAWEKSYGGSGSDFFGEVILQTSDGGYITTGYTASFGDWVEVGWILKLNADGTIAWQKTYGDYWQEIDAILETGDGGYLSAGHAYFSETNSGDLWIMKLNANGTVSWQKTHSLGDDYEVTVKSLIPATDGGYIVAGTFDYCPDGCVGSDIWIVKINDNGSIVWQKPYGGANDERGDDIQPTTDGGYIVIGRTASFGAGMDDIWILKIAANGTIAWQKTYGGAFYDQGEGIVQTTDGGYVAAGRIGLCDPNIPPYENCWDIIAFKLNAVGSIVWQKTYGGSDDEDTNGIVATSDGGYLVAGETLSFGTGSEDLWILKMDSDGSVGATDCGLVNSIALNVADTDVTVIDTDASASAYDGATADTDVSPQSTSANVTTQCE